MESFGELLFPQHDVHKRSNLIPDMFLNGNFVALEKFQERYGVLVSEPGVQPPIYAIETKWQSSLFQAGQCGAFIGVLIAGPITNILGYRWTTLVALLLMNATIFISFFVSGSKTEHDGRCQI